MTSFEKCKAAPGSYKVVRRFEENLIRRNLFLADNGRLDLHKYRSSSELSLDELRRISDIPCVIVFSEPDVPPIKCRFKRAVECLDEVAGVSGCFWITNGDCTSVIEFYRKTAVMFTLR